jgi:hypothetical protein
METCRSPLEVFLRACELARRVWPDTGRTARDVRYTDPQLFACLVLREQLRVSYRKAEAMLVDVPDWLGRVGMTAVPDHNTLWRAFGRLVVPSKVDAALDLMAEREKQSLDAGLATDPLTIDATCYEPRHRSRHYDRVCRKMAGRDGKKRAERPGKWGQSVNASRSRKARSMPKLSVAASSAGHYILAVKAAVGNGSDAPDFDRLLYDSWRRAGVKFVVADGGYDSEANHRIARLDMGVTSVIPPVIGRPTEASPTGRFRALMKRRFAAEADAAVYAQRCQSETINSMMKRNLGECLRSVLTYRRKKEMLLRSLVHNLMLGSKKRLA